MVDEIRDGDGNQNETDTTLFGRRSMLKATAGAAAFAAAGVGTSAAADGDYDVITVSAGDRYSVRLGSGDTFENKLIDITASGAKFRIVADGGGWAIRNVGIRGVWDSFDRESAIIVRADKGTTGVVENLYFGDGAIDDEYPGITALIVPDTHAGVLKIDRTNIQGMPDNAIYASGPGQSDEYGSAGAGGEVHITNSYAADCRAAHFRIGSYGSYVKNCVAVGGDRGFLGRFRHTEAYDSDFSGGRFGDVVVGAGSWESDASTEASVYLENCGYNTSHLYWDTNELEGESVREPRTEPPEGVPLTPEEAAAGGTTEEPESTRTLTIRDEEPYLTQADYEFTVSGDLEKSDANGASINDDDTVDGSTATGHVWGGTDSYAFTGDLTDFQVDSDVTVVIDGEEHDASDLMCEYSNVLTVNGTNGKTQYEFTVSDGLEKSVDDGATIDDHDTLDGSTASGHVWGWKDSYRFSGDVTSLTLRGPGAVYVNGEEVDPDQF